MKYFVPNKQQQRTDGYSIKGDGEKQGNYFSDGFVEPVKITAQGKQQVTVAFPYNKCDTYGKQETKFIAPL